MAIDRIERGRAAHAFQTVYDYITRLPDEKGRKEYVAHLKKVPSMIQVNGLGQTLAFLYAKGGQDRVVYRQLESWLRHNPAEILPPYDEGQNGGFVKTVVNLPSREYRIMTKEALALLNWMRRFAGGLKDDLEQRG